MGVAGPVAGLGRELLTASGAGGTFAIATFPDGTLGRENRSEYNLPTCDAASPGREAPDVADVPLAETSGKSDSRSIVPVIVPFKSSLERKDFHHHTEICSAPISVATASSCCPFRRHHRPMTIRRRNLRRPLPICLQRQSGTVAVAESLAVPVP